MYNMKKINFNLDDELYRDFKKYCIDISETMTNILVKLIKEEIGNHGKRHRRSH